MEIVFDVAVPNWARFSALFKRVSGKVERLGFEPLQFVAGDPYMVKVEGVRYECREVTIKCPDAESNGWVMTGRLEHLVGEEAIVHGDVPASFRELGPVCHHCDCKRHRRVTYLVKNKENKRRMLVGKSCLGEFLSTATPERLVKYFDQLALLEAEGAALREHDGEGVSFQQRFYDAMQVLVIVAHLIQRFGWMSAEKANREHGTSTGWRAIEVFQRDQVDTLLRETVNAADKERAQQVMEWLLSGEVEEVALESPYLHSLRAIARAGVLTGRAFGLWASAFAAYDNAERRKKAEANPTTSNPVGKRGERSDFTVTVLREKAFDGDYGTKTLFNLCDAEGNQLVWWSSGRGRLRVGEKYHITGKVEKQDIYRDKWQTTLSRVTVHDVKLLDAVEARDIKKLRKALKLGYFVDVRDGDGRTPLIRASQLGQNDVAVALLEAEADPNARDQSGMSVLEPACAQGNLELVRQLLDAGAIMTVDALKHVPQEAVEVRRLAETALNP